MKRFHIHVSVADLNEGIRFYSALFGSAPSRIEPDYAKWMLEDPRMNFAISKRGQPVGVNHLGLQVDSAEELALLAPMLRAADSRVVEEKDQPCCYARSDKYWVTDPAGVAWEAFHTLGSIPVYGEDTAVFGHGCSTTPLHADAGAAPCCGSSNVHEACCT